MESICYGCEKRDTKAFNLSRSIVSLQVLGHCFAFFTLWHQFTLLRSKRLLRVEESCCEKQSAGLFSLATNFDVVSQFFINSQLVLDPH